VARSLPAQFAMRVRGGSGRREEAGAEASFNSMEYEVRVDDVDLSILKWMYPGGEWSWFGTDPRITTAEIASRVGMDRTAVWGRISRWKRVGFWSGFQVNVNPQIFGVGVVRVEIPVLGPAQAADVLDALEHVDGALVAKSLFDVFADGGEGDGVSVTLAAEDAAHVRRRLRLFCGLSSTGSVKGPFRVGLPPCTHWLTPLDWRVLATVVANPNASPARLARLVGVTRKTFVQHHAILIERHAVYYIPRVDWSLLECVGLIVYCQSAEGLHRAREELQMRYPASIAMNLRGAEGVAPDWDDSTCFASLVPSHSPNAVHSLIRTVSRIPGVKFARSATWGPDRLYHDWISRRIAARIKATSVELPGGTPQFRVRRRGALAPDMLVQRHEMTTP